MNRPKLRSKAWWLFMLMGLVSGILAFVFGGWLKKEPIRLGFVAELTGRQAELGVQERNGVQLAVETVNASGGVARHLIELIVRDDLGTAEGARTAARELIDAGVVAIIGHATSEQTVAGLAVTNPARVVLLSPTASTPELSGLDDYFFRVIHTLVARTRGFTQHIYQRRGVTRLAFLYDTDNAAYTRSVLATAADQYQSLGGAVVAEASFSSKTQPDFTPLLEQLRGSKPEGLFIIANDFDTALIAQRVRLLDWQAPLFAAGWAQTETLINNGGQAVEGLETEQSYPLNSQASVFLDFKARFQARFGRVPSFGAAFGYEAVQVLAAALEKTGGRAAGLRSALVAIRDFKGLVDPFSFDQYGDAVRPFYIGVIQAGQYATFEVLKPMEP